MLRICGWCSKPMGVKPPLDDKSTTTSICPECLKKKTSELNREQERNADGRLVR